MRKIKFRGRHLRLPGLYGDWIYGSLYSDGANDNEPIIIERVGTGKYYPVDPATVGQFTGMYDCDGREIYEGDVIRSDLLPHMRTTVCNGCIVYKNGAFYVEYIDHTYANLGDLIFYSGTSTTVIGNIHDDPKLMEVAHD